MLLYIKQYTVYTALEKRAVFSLGLQHLLYFSETISSLTVTKMYLFPVFTCFFYFSVAICILSLASCLDSGLHMPDTVPL